MLAYMKKCYQEWQENSRSRYYPRHGRTPNLIVRLLYGFGFFVGDFVPLTLNLIDGIYRTLKRFLSFIVGLLIEASTVVVLIGTIAFSVAHSIELLRRAGATDGLEYVGVLMFEIVFISSTAILTGMLMNWNPKVFRSAGFWFCSTAFMVGVGFVLWSNISAMAPTLEGKAIGILTPLLLIISEGLLAFRNVEAGGDMGYIPAELLKWLQENKVSPEEIIQAVEAFRKEQIDTLSDLAQMMEKHHVSADGVIQQVQGYRTDENRKVAQAQAENDQTTQETKPTAPITQSLTQEKEKKTIPSPDRMKELAENDEKEQEAEKKVVAKETEKPATQPEPAAATRGTAKVTTRKQEKEKSNSTKQKKSPTKLSDKRSEKEENARKAAYKLWKETGIRPGRDKIMEHGNVGSTIAKRIATELKEEEKRLEKLKKEEKPQQEEGNLQKEEKPQQEEQELKEEDKKENVG